MEFILFQFVPILLPAQHFGRNIEEQKKKLTKIFPLSNNIFEYSDAFDSVFFFSEKVNLII